MKRKELIFASLIICAGAGMAFTGCHEGERAGEGTVNAYNIDTVVYLTHDESSPSCHIKLDFKYLIPYGEKDSVSDAINYTLKQMYFGDLYAGLDSRTFVDSITRSLIKDYRHDVMECYRTDIENGIRPEDMPRWYNYEFEISSELEKGRDSIWNYKVTTYQNTGGAHPNTWAKWVNVDSHSGHAIDRQEIFAQADMAGIRRLLLEKIIEASNERLDTDTITCLDGLHANGVLLNEDIFIPENFLLKDGSIEFLYNTYEIAPYYMGKFELSVTDEEITPHLTMK